MQPIKAVSQTTHIHHWLEASRQPRVLHIFDSACNLINECKEVLSIVTPRIGTGPFHLVVEHDICFSKYMSLESPVSIAERQLRLGELTINVRNTQLWNPQPNWSRLHYARKNILAHLTQLQIMGPLRYRQLHERSGLLDHWDTSKHRSLISNLSSSLAAANLSGARDAAKELAGLGIGLTPAGDDLILGAIYAAWILHPVEVASLLAEEVANAAAPWTTSLSAMWLRSAGRGEAGILWHEFFEALITSDLDGIQSRVTELLALGHTSGADALLGFTTTLKCWSRLNS